MQSDSASGRWAIGQMGLFDLEKRCRDLEANGDPLLKIDEIISWESFRAELKAAWRMAPEARKSKAGRPPWDEIVMLEPLVLAELYNLSDDQIEYRIRDRYSFGRFLRLALVAHGSGISLGLLGRQTGPSDNPGAQML